ncbi:MAG: hypothetical protein ACE5I3_15325 [Phycisphaerae bacterium]
MQSEPDRRSPPPSWRRVFLAPWLGTVRPAAAAACLVAAPARAFWLICFAHFLLLAVLLTVLMVWNVSLYPVWAAPPTTLPGGDPDAPGYVAPPPGEEVRSHTFAEVWRDLHAETLLGPAELLFLTVLAVAALLTALLAWLNLPRLHRAGPVVPSISRALRAVASAFGLGSLLTLALATLVILTHCRPLPRVIMDSPFFFCLPVAIAWLLWRIGRAVEHVQLEPFPDLPPCCEGCGYDLSHQSSDTRCPECGLVVADSLSPDRRPGCGWEQPPRPRMREWFETTQMVMLLPREFYGKLRLRTPLAAAASFAVRNYVFIGVGAGVWVLLMWWATQSGVGSFVREWQDVLMILSVFSLWTPLACWFGHRLGGALVISWWIARRSLPDTRSAAKVLAYEAAYLWVFCAFWGAFATSFVMVNRPWISEMFGSQFFYAVFRAPGEIVVLFGGTGLLALVWLWRYAVALRAIRWSNY